VTIGLVIFDCDGVLVDSEPLAIGILRDVLARHGTDIDEDTAYELFLGKSVASITATVQDNYGGVFAEEQIIELRAAVETGFRKELEPTTGIAEALDRINIRKCVASSSYPARIRMSLEVTGLLAKLDGHLYSAAMVARGKPFPDLFLHAAASEGVPPADCIVIEDSPTGIVAAKAAGMRVFGYIGGSHGSRAGYREILEQLEPDLIFNHMNDLPGLLDQGVRGTR
jgi:HAD superfamily hydrolase (TIGR01509 family)